MSQLSLLAGLPDAGNPLLTGLNAAQAKAVLTVEGPVLVVAAPGSGKTTVLTRRVAHMVNKGVAPEAIMAVTFTRKAADEMAERVAKAVGQKSVAERLTIGTFHSICLKILEGRYPLLGFDPDRKPHLVMPSTQRALFDLLLKEHGISDVRFDDLATYISRAKCMLVTPGMIQKHSADPAEMRYAMLYGEYQKRLVKQNMLDFDDQIGLAVRLLDTIEAVRNEVQSRYQFILVDEYQDTNRAQYELLRLLAAPQGNLFAVGDDAQGIYGFRAADLNNILNFKKDYPGSAQLVLETNYRSTPQIVALANQLIAHNAGRIDKTIIAARPGDQASVRIVQFADNFTEAEETADRLKAWHAQGIPYSEMAVLCRTHAQGMPFQDALSSREIPYSVKKSGSFYEQAEIAETLAYMQLGRRGRHPLADLGLEKLLGKLGLPREAMGMLKVHAEVERTDLASACRMVEDIPLPTLAQKGLVKHVTGMIAGWQRHQGSIADLYLQVISQTQTKAKFEKKKNNENAQKLDGLSSLHAQISRWNPSSIADLFNRIDQASKPPKAEKRGETVQLLTIHASKGLEWDVVIVPGMEEGILPFQMALDEGDLSEERRLCYVAITRARTFLQLGYGRERSNFGKAKEVTPSRFLNEMKTAREA